MTSTYQSFTLDTRNMTSTLSRVSSQTTTKRDIDYYNAHIGNVKTLDDLMGDYQLYSYAMKAYGLEDFTYAKGFMKKVFSSDLSDATSFANRLNDPKYKQIAAAFNFGASGTPTAQTAATSTKMFGAAAARRPTHRSASTSSPLPRKRPRRRPRRTITTPISAPSKQSTTC